MIAVAGINTAIDKLIDVDAFGPGLVVRARDAREWPGGKGAHAAMCAAALGERVRLVGLIDAAHRDWFTQWLRERCVEFHGVEARAPVRTCLAIRDDAGCVTEIREPGRAIDADEWRALKSRVAAVCSEATVAVLSGSVPPGVPASAYRDLAGELAGVRVLVDASGDLLRLAIGAAPFCIKPNCAEAEALTGLTLDSPAAAARAGRILAAGGVQLAIISMGPAGAVACWRDRACLVAPPSVVPLNAVGAGDCLMAGIAVGLARGHDIEEVLRLGIACGTAKVLSPDIGLVRREDIDDMLSRVRLTWID